MQQHLTQEQKTQLLHAIAISGGSGMYLDDWKAENPTPHCIIGCLARNVGVSIDSLRQWDSGHNTNGCSLHALIGAVNRGVNVPELGAVLPFNVLIPDIPEFIQRMLSEYHPDPTVGLLRIIQRVWDAECNEYTRQALKDWVLGMPTQD